MCLALVELLGVFGRVGLEDSIFVVVGALRFVGRGWTGWLVSLVLVAL